MARTNTQLPDPDAPMYAEDGTVVAPSVPSMYKRVELPSATQAVRLVSNTRRKLADLPALPQQLNSYSVVLVYTASGLSDAEIATATGFTVQQIRALREHDAYKMLEQLVLKTAREEAQGIVKGILVEAEEKAARKISELVTFEDPVIALRAAQDVLNRGGHSAPTEVNINQNMMNTFRIEVVDRRNEKPVIDMEVDNGNGS